MSKTSNPQKRRKSSQNRPVFVPNIQAGAANLVDMVSGVAATNAISGVRYGIVNGVVTEFGVNQPALEDDGLRGCPAFTQLCKQSETLTDSEWSKMNELMLILNGSFQDSNVYICKESTSPDSWHILGQTAFSGLSDNSVIGLCCVAKYKGRELFIVGSRKNNDYTHVSFNLLSGVAQNYDTTNFYHIQKISSEYWLIFVAINVGTGAFVPQLYMQLENCSYTGDGVSGVYISQPTLINFGVNGVPFIPPYVPNNTNGTVSVVSETGSATNGTSFDLDNPLMARIKTALRGPNAQGHLDLTFKSNIDSGWLPSGEDVVLSILNTGQPEPKHALCFRKGTDNIPFFRLSDGVAVAAVTPVPLSIGQIFKISIDWGTHPTGQKMRLTVNGVKSALVDFSGSFGSQDLRFFYDNTVHAGWIKKDSLKIYDRPRW